MNEQHELSRVDHKGGGRLPQYAGIAWADRASHISQSLSQVDETIQASSDPLKDTRYFVVAVPVPSLQKTSKDKRKAPTGVYSEDTDFGGLHGRVFDRLGLDLLQVTEDGAAIVHAERDAFSRLISRSHSLDSVGPREQARWATIQEFGTIPIGLRVDAEWLQAIPPQVLTDVVFELQPVLGRVEVDRVLRGVADVLLREKGALAGTGTDFSGRYWFRGKASKQAIRRIAKEFFSVQAIHSPLYSLAASARAPGRLRHLG